MRCVLGNGMVVHPQAFLDEIDQLESLGVSARGRLFVSERAQLLFDLHVALDVAREKALGDFKIGTTSRGIGPAYEAKVARCGLRLGDLWSTDFEGLLEERIARQIRDLGRGGERRDRVRRNTPARGGVEAAASTLRRRHLDAAQRLARRRIAAPVRGRAGNAARRRSRHLPLRDQLELDRGLRRHRFGRAADRDSARGRRAQGLHHAGRRRPLPDRAARRHRRVHPPARQRVRHHHRPAAPLRLARPPGRALRAADQRRRTRSR